MGDPFRKLLSYVANYECFDTRQGMGYHRVVGPLQVDLLWEV